MKASSILIRDGRDMIRLYKKYERDLQLLQRLIQIFKNYIHYFSGPTMFTTLFIELYDPLQLNTSQVTLHPPPDFNRLVSSTRPLDQLFCIVLPKSD